MTAKIPSGNEHEGFEELEGQEHEAFKCRTWIRYEERGKNSFDPAQVDSIKDRFEGVLYELMHRDDG